jgi:RNA polymerase sigma factor (sigma-70 family)
VARSLSRDDLYDCLALTVFHCVKDNYRILRQYRDVGKPFKAWLYLVASHKAIDYIRDQQRQGSEAVEFDDTVQLSEAEDPPSSDLDLPDKQLETKELMEAFRIAAAKLSLKCRALLEMWIDGFTPKEMVLVLKLEKEKNKEVSDGLRYCLGLLKKNMTVSEGGVC